LNGSLSTVFFRNEKADELSKQALALQVHAFGLSEFFDGVETKSMEFQL